VVACLFRCKFTNWRKHTEGIASQHDDIRGLTLHHARNLRVVDEFNWVRTPSVLGYADIIVIWQTSDGIVDDVLEDAAETNGIIDIGFIFGGEVNTFGITTSFDVENASV